MQYIVSETEEWKGNREKRREERANVLEAPSYVRNDSFMYMCPHMHICIFIL